jgi:hypothetical protein
MTIQEERAAKIKAARNKSLRLMQMDANGTLDKIAEGKKDKINESFTDAEMIPTDMMQAPRQNMAANIASGKMSVAAGNVPSIIRESFQSQPPLAQQEVTSSVLDGMFGDLLQERQNPQQVITETVQQPQQVVQQYPSQIDYPMIRTIVEEIVRKYTSSLSKKMVNEGKGSEINTISLGKSFKFLANNGDIFECTMRKVGNINKKKSVE